MIISRSSHIIIATCSELYTFCEGVCFVDRLGQIVSVPLEEDIFEDLELDFIAPIWVFLRDEAAVPELTAESPELIVDLFGNAVVVVECLRVGVGGVPSDVCDAVAYDESIERVNLPLGVAVAPRVDDILVPLVDLFSEVRRVYASVGLAGDEQFVLETLGPVLIEVAECRKCIH